MADATAALRRASVELRRASVELKNLVLNDLADSKSAARKVAPTPPPDGHHGAPASNAAASSSNSSLPTKPTVVVALPLLDKPASIWIHALRDNLIGLIGAIIAALLLYPVHRFLEYLTSTVQLDRGFTYTTVACLNVEVLALIASWASKEYWRKKMFVAWPCYLLVLVLSVLSTAVSSPSGEVRAAGIPVALVCWALSIDSAWFYTREKHTFISNSIKSGIFVIVCAVMNFLPSFTVLIPVHYLAANHPYWNIVVSGIGFPALTFVLKKLCLSYLLGLIQEKAENGDVPVDEVLTSYTANSKVVSICLMLGNIVMMYLSTSKRACLLSALFSVVTELGGKTYVAWQTRRDVKKHLARVAIKGAKLRVVGLMDRLAAEPGVLSISNEELMKKERLKEVSLWGKGQRRDAGDEEEWKKVVALDRENRCSTIDELLDPGLYTKEEKDKINDALLLADKFKAGDDKHDHITLTKRESFSPLSEVYVCHDRKLKVTYGKESSVVRGASLLDAAAYLVSFDSLYYKKYLSRPSGVKFRVLERVNKHHQMWYYYNRGVPPYAPRDFVWSVIFKRISDDQYTIVLLPALHNDAPITKDTVRAESTRVYQLTKIEQDVTKLELFVTLDLKGFIPTFLTNSVVIPVVLRASAPLHFIQIKDYENYDAAGEDARALGQRLIDETRPLHGEAKKAALRTFISRSAALRHVGDKYPWLFAMILCVVENTLAVGRSAIPATDESVLDPESIGKSLAFCLQAQGLDKGVEDWIRSHRLLVELDKQEPQFFRPFMTVIAKNLFAGEESVVDDKNSEEENWEFILGMLAARWSQDIIAEKSAILMAAFLVHLFKFTDLPLVDLLEIMGIFIGFEAVTDLLLVYVLDAYFDLPFRRLPERKWKDLLKDAAILSQVLICIACGLSVANTVVNS